MDVLAITGLSGLLSYSAAEQQQQAQAEYMRQAYAAQQAAIGAQNRMVRQQESQEQVKARTEAQLLQSRLRASAGESGLGLGGTYEALSRQIDYDAYRNNQVSIANANNQFAANASRMQPIQGQYYNPLLSGITGALTGLSTGMQIDMGVSQINPKLGKTLRGF